MNIRLTARSPRVLAGALLAGILSLATPGAAWTAAELEPQGISERQVKAAFLLNLSKFVYWPGPAEGLLVIGIAGDDALPDVVDQVVRGKTVNGREFRTRRLAIGEDPAGCHLLVVGAMRAHEARELLERVRGPVLTVGESLQFIRDGGMVRFYVEKNKMRFQVSQKNAEAAGLKVSSQLLLLAAR